MTYSYDGKAIGSFSPDTTREFTLGFEFYSGKGTSALIKDTVGDGEMSLARGSNFAASDSMWINTLGNFSHETAGASIASLVVITY